MDGRNIAALCFPNEQRASETEKKNWIQFSSTNKSKWIEGESRIVWIVKKRPVDISLVRIRAPSPVWMQSTGPSILMMDGRSCIRDIVFTDDCSFSSVLHPSRPRRSPLSFFQGGGCFYGRCNENDLLREIHYDVALG